MELLRAPVVRRLPEDVRALVVKMIFVHQLAHLDALEGPPMGYEFPFLNRPFAPWFFPFQC